MSAAAVARSLNARGITGKRGGKWQGQSVKRTISHTFHANRMDFPFPSNWGTMPWHRKGAPLNAPAATTGRDKHGPLQALVNGLIVYKGV